MSQKQPPVADQRATQKLLTAALNILKGFYAKKAKAFVQTQDSAGPPIPGVMGMKPITFPITFFIASVLKFAYMSYIFSYRRFPWKSY